MSKGNLKDWSGVIAAVKTPLGLLALFVLVVFGILVPLAYNATGIDRTILIVGMLLCLLFLIHLGGRLIEKPSNLSPSNPQSSTALKASLANYKYDVFLSSPMAGHADPGEYKRNRDDVVQFVKSLRTKCNFETIYYAGQDIATKAEFELPDISAADVLEALKSSKIFVLIYPSKIVSSSLLESGCALALKKPSVYFVRSKNDLPFLMEKAEQAFPNMVKIHECDNMTDILKRLEQSGEKLFPSVSN